MGKVTVREEATFVITLITRDLDSISSDNKKLTYLKIIGDHIDDVGERILSANPEAHNDSTLIEHETQSTISESEKSSSRIDVISSLFEATRPSRVLGLNPVEFIRSGKCLMDEDAYAWLYERKYTQSYNHIHVYPNDMCLTLPTKDSVKITGHEYAWVEPDGIREEGDLIDVLQKMFWAYLDTVEAKLNG
jgi:hypothetical protein